MSEVLVESVDFDLVENKIEEEVSGMTKVKKYYLQGPMIESDTKNHNGRIYPRSVLEREVKKINETKIKQNRFVGELLHPASSELGLNVSHLIKELRMDGNIGYGKALVLDTPCGKIIKAMMDEGIKLGVSSRGLGTLKESIVQNDYRLVTIDCVFDPSAPSAFVDNLIESRKDWIMENGILTEKDVEEVIQKSDQIIIEHRFSVEEKQAAFMTLFNSVLNKIVTKK